MSDLIERLETAETEDLHNYAAVELAQLMGEAAQQIERLEGLLCRLVAAIEDCDDTQSLIDEVDAALEAKAERLNTLDPYKGAEMSGEREGVCKYCRWWRQGASALIGECRRMPPAPAENIADPRWWPNTHRDDWCGEFAALEAKR